MFFYYVATGHVARRVPVTPVRDEKDIIDCRDFFVSTYKENYRNYNWWQ